MSWLFSRALVEDCLALANLEYPQSAPLSAMTTVDAYLSSDKISDSLEPVSRYGMTFNHLTEDRGGGLLTSSLVDFLVKRSLRQRGDAMWHAICGQKCFEWQGRWLLSMYSQKMFQPQPLSEQQQTSPRWVTTPTCFPCPRKTWVETTFGDDIGYLHTPTTKANYAASSMQKHESCRNFVKVFGRPSPENQEYLMGFPQGWTDTAPLEMGKYLSWRRRLCGHLRTLLDGCGGK